MLGVLGEVGPRSGPGVRRPFAVLPAIGELQRGAVEGWLVVDVGRARFPEFVETWDEVEKFLGAPCGRSTE